MSHRELLRQVRILDPTSNLDRIGDVLVEDGHIRAIADALPHPAEPAEIREAQGLILGPGLVDLYSHSGEPGFEDRETLASLMEAAQAGGFTRLTVLPTTDPPLDHPGQVSWMQSHWQALEPDRTHAANIRLQVWGALTAGVQGQQMTEFADLKAAGVIGFADGKPIANFTLLRHLLEYLAVLDCPIALWPCDRALAGKGGAREGTDAIQFGIPGSPAMSETVALAALLEVVAEIGTPVHIMRVSTARSVELIQTAKDRGVPITASTTWLHLLCNTQDLSSYDPNLRLDPPLGTPQDQQALRDGLKAGVLDAIAIDHSPYTYEEKTVAFGEAPPGAIGLELALPLLWQTLVEAGDWSALDLWRCLSTHPAQCLRQSPPVLQPDQPAEMILFAPQTHWTVEAQTLRSLATNTSWLGQTLQGRVLKLWSR